MLRDQRLVVNDDIDIVGPGEFPLWMWLMYVALAVGFCLLLVLAYSLGRRSSLAPGPAPGPPMPSVVEPAMARDDVRPPPTERADLEADRARASLVEGLIQAYDLAGQSPAMRSHVEQSLRRAGVTRIGVQPGDRFEPTLQQAVDIRPSEDPARAHLVAEVVRPGWQDGGRAIRPAEVAVWTS